MQRCFEARNTGSTGARLTFQHDLPFGMIRQVQTSAGAGAAARMMNSYFIEIPYDFAS
ncbi:hypothetical protein SAMN05443247_03142 [Bradyrhizobium erythrophlei]|jgi:hypothetical protein|nr:hypothetical protein SAMN05443247_03142 [Bradyrhizobium erythrophlei]